MSRKRRAGADIAPRYAKRSRGVTYVAPAVAYSAYQKAIVMKQNRANMARRYARGRRRARNRRTGGYLGIELKFYDQLLIGKAITAPTDASGGETDPSATVLLNTVVQGDGESNRDGRQIVMKKIMIKGNVSTAAQINQTAVDVAPYVFIALVLDTQTNGATLNSEDVFVNPGANAITAAAPLRNLQYTKRFKVLATRTLVLPIAQASYDGTNIEVGGSVIPFEIYKDLNNIKVTYSATTETVANIVDNSLHVIAYASSADISPLLNYSSRLRFCG